MGPVLCDSKMVPLLVKQRIVAHEKKGGLLLAWIINALCYWKHHYKDIKPLFLCLLLSIRWGKQETQKICRPCNKSFTAFSKLHFHLSHIAMHNKAHMKQDQPVQHKSLEVFDKRLRRVCDNQYVQSAISTVLHE